MWRRLILATLLILLLGIAAAMGAAAAGFFLIWPRPEILGAPPGALAEAEALSFPSASGSTIHGWFAPPSHPGAGAVLLLHGYRSNRGAMVRRAIVLRQHGYGVLLIDLQAEGESPGRFITFGKLESLDVKAAVEELRHRAPAERIGAIGLSLGGAALAMAAPDTRMEALILESVFPTLHDALRNRLAAVFPSAIVPLLTSVFEAMLPPILGFPVSDVQPARAIGGVSAPLLILSGQSDTRTTVAETQAMFDASAPPKQLWIVPEAGHVDLEQVDTAAYWSQLLPFLDGTLHPMPL